MMYAVNWLWLAEGSWWIARLAWSNMMLAVAEGVSMAKESGLAGGAYLLRMRLSMAACAGGERTL